MAGLRATLELCRFDPQTDREARWELVEVTLPEGSTVLEALMHVQEHIDGSLAFRRSCRHGICGSCGMRINGCARLACNTQLTAAVEQARRMAAVRRLAGRGAPASADVAPAPVRVEPLGNMPVIKDLICDMSAFWVKLHAVRPWLQSLQEAPDPDRERLMTQDDWTTLAEGVLCLECGCCSSDCCSLEADEEFAGPAALVKAYRYACDTRDDQTHRRLSDLSAEHGLWGCTRCSFCTERCPKHLRVRDLIVRLGQLAWAEGLRADPGAERCGEVMASVRDTGRAHEFRLPPRMEDIVKTPARVSSAARALSGGEAGGDDPVPVERLEELRAILNAAEERE